MDENYKPVPVSVAQAIALTYDKSQVVVLTYDPVYQCTHTTTFGVEPFDKENAAAAGEICTKAIGADLSKKQTFEDFHDDYDPAVYKAALDFIQKFVARNMGPPVIVQQAEQILKAAGKAPRRA